MKREAPEVNRTGTTITVVGCGNIGSHLVPHLARLPRIGGVTLVDPDTYEAKNVAGQAIELDDVGKPKVRVQARRLKRIHPGLEVRVFEDRVENVPAGLLRADVMVCALDSRSSRQVAAQIAWRLGVPLVDAGVQVDGLLARVSIFVPDGNKSSPCMECGWSTADYDAIEQTYPCGADPHVAPTDAPSSLGALAASLQALECRKLLDGAGDRAAVGQQILLDAAFHRAYRTDLKRNAECRFDHETWTINRLHGRPRDVPLASLLALGRKHMGNTEAIWLSVDRKWLLEKLACRNCGNERPLFRWANRFRPNGQTCSACGRDMTPAGHETRDRVNLAALPVKWLRRSLARFGVCSGDLLTLTHGGCHVHFEIGADGRQIEGGPDVEA